MRFLVTASGASFVACALVLFGNRARADDKNEVTVAAPAPPSPASASGALWAALSGSTPDLALEDVLAASGYAFRATVCANDCLCREWREEGLGLTQAARALGREPDRIDLARAKPEAVFARVKTTIDAGRAALCMGPREAGVVYGYKHEPRSILVKSVSGGESHEEARPLEKFMEMWELVVLEPGKTPRLDAATLEQRAILFAVAHAHRPAQRGSCGFLDPPATNAWGLAAYGVMAAKLAGDRGIAGAHTAVADRAAFLASARLAASAFLERAYRRRERASAGSGVGLAAVAKAYKAEVDEGLGPFERLVTDKDETAYAREGLKRDAAAYLAKAARREHEALGLLEKEALASSGSSQDVLAALSLSRTTPVSEGLAPELAKLAENADPDMRLLAVSALADAQGPVAAKALGKALLDHDGPVGDGALAALTSRNEPGLADTLARAYEEAPRDRTRTDVPLQRLLLFALADLGAQEPKTIATLERGLEDSGEGDEIPEAIPRFAASLLYRLRGIEAEPALLKAIKSPRWASRRAAVSMLDLSGSKEALAAIDQALLDEELGIRLAAASALGRRGRERAIKAALASLRDASRDARSAAVEALVRIGPPGFPYLVRLLRDDDWHVRANACIVLARAGGADELAKVAALANDPEAPIRELALEAKAILDARAKATEKK